MSYNLTTMQSIYHNQDEIVEITYNNSSVYHKSSGPDYTEPFYVENISNENETLNITKVAKTAPTLTIQYSTDKTKWRTLGTTSTTALTYTLHAGNKIYLRCSANKWSSSNNRNTITGVSKVGGNIMSLLYGNSFTGNEISFPNGSTHNFNYLFGYNTRLIDASNLLLPATTLAEYCYRGMFSNCTSLTSAPALPATTLVTSCYSYIFRDCTSLTSAPELPATTLADYCYSLMFFGCTALITVKCLATDISATDATYCWFENASATGTFTKAAGVTWPTGDSGIPSGWTVIEV